MKPVVLLERLDELGWQHGVSPIAFKNSRGSAFRNAVAKLAKRESRNARFEIPTTGVIAGGEYFFIANPGLRSFDEHGRIWPWELEDPVMLRLGL